MDYQTLFIELAVLAGLGLLYYFWEKKRILQFEENKAMAIASPLLQACLIEQEQTSFTLLDNFILALDDFLHGKTSYFPTSLAQELVKDPKCPEDLAAIITESLKEMDHD